MTELFEVLNQIRSGGGAVFVNVGDLEVRTPKGFSLSPEQRTILAENKPTLLSLLQPSGSVSVSETQFHPRNSEVSDTDTSEAEGRAAIQSEDSASRDQVLAARRELRQEIATDPTTGKPRWWSKALSDQENRTVDEFMSYDVSGPAGDQDLTSMARTEIDDLPPCRTCGSLWQWQDAANDQWHCRTCDPPGIVRTLTRYVYGKAGSRPPLAGPSGGGADTLSHVAPMPPIYTPSVQGVAK